MKTKIFFSIIFIFLSVALYAQVNCDCCRNIIPENSLRANNRTGISLPNYTEYDIREVLRTQNSIYQGLRVQCENEGTITYRVPVQIDDTEYFLSSVYSRKVRNNPFPVTKILDSGLSDSESIVVILFGDAFTAAQYGTWPNPNSNTVLAYARDAMNTKLNTHPFNLFSHLFSVYVIHTTNGNDGFSGYLGTVDYEGFFDVMGWSQQMRIHELADAVVSPNHQTMIQVISNALDGTGYAWMPFTNDLSVLPGATSIRRGSSVPGGSNLWGVGTAWHGTFIHEFGHSYGTLVDEHSEGSRTEVLTNSTQQQNHNIKWGHWFGHRNVLQTPTRFDDGWAVPAFVSDVQGLSGCLMRASWGNRNFCGVCQAELTRRMALISGETFIGRHPNTFGSIPNQGYIVLPAGTTRILDSAFHGNIMIQQVTIPATISTIGDYAFLGAVNLYNIINHSIAPQQIDPDIVFAGVDRSYIGVHVGQGLTQEFINAGWTDFNILETLSNISVSPSTFNFGTINLESSSTTQIFTISNTSAENLSIESITLGGIDQAHFNITGDTDFPWSIEPSGTRVFYVSFSPESVGAKSANVSIVHNAIGSIAAVHIFGFSDTEADYSAPYFEDFNSGISLSAIGWSGNISQYSGIQAGSGVNGTNGLALVVWEFDTTQAALTPRIGQITQLSNLSFSYRIVNYTTDWYGDLIATTLSDEDRVFIEVSTTGPMGSFIPINEINNTNHISSTSFTMINESLSSFADRNIVVRFRPQRSSGTWFFVIDDVSIINGDAPIWSINPTAHNFGDIYVDSISETQTFTITNVGTENLSITAITLGGSHQTQFSISSNIGLPWSIEPYQTNDFMISFSPASVGVKTANVSISHNSFGSPSSVSLSGTGVIPQPGLSFTLINEGTAYEVSRGTANTNHIDIPDTHLGLPVVTIAENGFANFTMMTSIDIPISVSVIGASAFSGCDSLTRIDIPIGVVYIGAGTFIDCSNLTIYASATNPESDPSSPALGWAINWNPDHRPVVWGSNVSGRDEIEIISPTSLYGNFPNPFNPETTINFSVGKISSTSAKSADMSLVTNGRLEIAPTTHVSIKIYNLKGQQVRRLVDGRYSSGDYSVVWDGTDDSGRSVGSGVYFYRLNSDGFIYTKKMVLMK
jgi:hypothetical protein